MQDTLVIRPVSGAQAVDFGELYRYRGLLRRLVWKEVRVKFDSMHLGLLWPTARPLLMVCIFVLFKNVSQARTGETVPFPLFVYSGIIAWFYFAETLGDVAFAFQRDAGLIAKVYYPRLISPLVSIVSNLYDLAIAAVPLVVMMIYYRIAPGVSVLLLPLVLAQMLILTLGAGLIFATLALRVRDFERFLGLVVYVGLFLSPVYISLDRFTEGKRFWALINPMAGTLSAWRAALFGQAFPWTWWLQSCVITGILLALGWMMFRRVQAKILELL